MKTPTRVDQLLDSIDGEKMKFATDNHEPHPPIAAPVAFFAPGSGCRHPFPGDDQIIRRINQKEDTPPQKEHIGNRQVRPRAILVVCWISLVISLRTAQAQSQTSAAVSVSNASLTLEHSKTNFWQNGIGNGFKPGTKDISISIGAGLGFVSFLGGKQRHDLTFASLSYGCMLGHVIGQDHWYRGNWELRGELFSGEQFSPTSDWLVGLTPHLRYNFATGTRWIPYVDGGAGVTATSIGPPDLSHYFEFNLQAAAGVRWFIKDNVALGIEARYIHISCAGINTPNQGLNNVNGMVGVSWFF